MNTWMEAARFNWDVQRVMAARLMRLASGGPIAATEAQQMVSEKAVAFYEAHSAMLTALMTGSSFNAAAAKAYAPIRRRVRANRHDKRDYKWSSIQFSVDAIWRVAIEQNGGNNHATSSLAACDTGGCVSFFPCRGSGSTAVDASGGAFLQG